MKTDGKSEYLVLAQSTGEGSGYAIYKHPESSLYELFSRPLYGGEESFDDCFPSIEECVKETESWT